MMCYTVLAGDEVASSDTTAIGFDVWDFSQNYPEDSTTYITLYDPWGSLLDPWGSLLEITLSQFKSNFGTVTASLASDNHFPIAVDDSAVTDVDSPVTINVLANDSDPEGDPIFITSIGLPGYGMTVNNGDGTITYTPNAGYNGIDTFTYVVRDGNGGLAQATVTVSVLDADAPLVSKVLVSSNSWPQAFLDVLGDVGFPIPAGPSQLDALPWANINTISMVFSEDVNISQGDLRVYGVSVPEYAFAGFDYDNSTRTATWTLGENVGGDVLSLVLSDAVVDLTGNRLDGEWADATSTYPSGNGSSGGEFQMRIDVLPCDADGNGTVGFGDLLALQEAFGFAGYRAAADFDGNGVVDAADYITLKRNFGGALPAPSKAPIAAPSVGPAESPTAEIATVSQVGVGTGDVSLIADMPVGKSVEPEAAFMAASAATASMEPAAGRLPRCLAEIGKPPARANLRVPQAQGPPVAHVPWRPVIHDSELIDVLRISRCGVEPAAGLLDDRPSQACDRAEQAGPGDGLGHLLSSDLALAWPRILTDRIGSNMPSILGQTELDVL